MTSLTTTTPSVYAVLPTSERNAGFEKFLVPNRSAYKQKGPTCLGVARLLAGERHGFIKSVLLSTRAKRWVTILAPAGSDLAHDLKQAAADGVAAATFVQKRRWPTNIYFDDIDQPITWRVVYDRNGRRQEKQQYRQTVK